VVDPLEAGQDATSAGSAFLVKSTVPWVSTGWPDVAESGMRARMQASQRRSARWIVVRIRRGADQTPGAPNAKIVSVAWERCMRF
jgi:hypothetical protein